MTLEDIRLSTDGKPAELLIDTPAEEPMMTREWLQAAAEIVLLVAVVLPIWTLLGIVLIGPALLLKKYAHLFSEANQKKIDKLHGFTTEIFEILSAVAKFPLAYCMPLENVEQEGRPILLVHGYLHNASGWIPFLKGLGEQKIGPVYTINLGHPFLPLSEYAKRVEEKAKKIREERKRDDLILIGHSMGGVVSSLYASKFAPENTATVFTVGSPHAGSHVASLLGVGPNGREMKPNAPILKEIQESLRTKNIPFYQIGSEADLLVSADSALTGLGKQLRLTDLGHVSLMSSEKVLNWIATELRSAL